MPSVRLSWRPIDGADVYRLVVYDRTDAVTIVDELVAGGACTVAIPDERGNHDLAMRVRARRGERWDEWAELQPLPLEAVLGERRDPQPPLSPAADPGLLLLFTVDTECSVLRQPNPDPERVVDELIFGDFGKSGRQAGVGLHMDLLEHFGFRGSFFVDVLMEFEHGQAALERVVEAIAGRGHEVELHVHPEHLQWSRDPEIERLAGELSGGRALRDREAFRRLLELSADLFERRVGRRPVAYRAGGYRIADLQFPVLEELGIRVDSSVQPYFNSLVSDWMRTRTQPFRVGAVLEAPPTFLVLNETPGGWETRGFTPNTQLGDPVSALPYRPGAAPHVATFVSHSFQLLRRYDSDDPEQIEAFVRRFRSVLAPGTADRYLGGLLRAVRTFGEEVDDGLVAAVAGLLRRVADRPDARCATYAELAAAADRFWPAERHPPVDPVPLLDRNRGETGVSGTRVFSPDLLRHLARSAPALRFAAHEEPRPATGWESGEAGELKRRLDSAAAQLRPGETLRLRLHTLGVAPPERRGKLPPLAEVLFPSAAVEAAREELGAEPWHGLPWDGATFLAWLARNGFEAIAARAVPRPPEELAALAPFAEKLAWLERAELEAEALEVELRPGTAPPAPRPGERVDPASLPDAATALYDSMHPGEERGVEIAADSTPATKTTRLLSLMRAGLEVVGREAAEYRLLRPLDLSDIRRFAGLDPKSS